MLGDWGDGGAGVLRTGREGVRVRVRVRGRAFAPFVVWGFLWVVRHVTRPLPRPASLLPACLPSHPLTPCPLASPSCRPLLLLPLPRT
jgi:hypothetical protein